MSDDNNNKKYDKAKEAAKQNKQEATHRFIKPKNAALLVAVIAFAFFIQVYRQFVLSQVRNIGAILPGHIAQKDIGKNMYELIEARGFKSEQHFVTNKKGYILQLARIVNPHVKDRKKLRPIILHHGFQCTGTLYIITNDGWLGDNGKYVEFDSQGNVRNGTSNTLGFLLATSGYDVWLANYRGSPYSSNHTELSTDESKFWNFTVDDLIEEDYPVLINHVLTTTKHKTLGYIGHSLGNFMMFGLLSKHPEYSEVIKPFVAVSPVFYMNELKTPLAKLRHIRNLLRRFPTAFVHMDSFRHAYSTFCSNNYLRGACHWLFRYIIGLQKENIDMDRIGVFIDNLPMGSGSVVAAQLGQIIGYQPTMFDFGSSEQNHQHYRSEVPPLYDASKINSTDIALLYAKDDWFNTMVNIQLLKEALKVPLLGDVLTPDPSWGHMELLWAEEVGKEVNEPVLQWLNKYRNIN